MILFLLSHITDVSLLISKQKQTFSGTGEVPYYAEETSKTVLRKFPRKSNDSLFLIIHRLLKIFLKNRRFCKKIIRLYQKTEPESMISKIFRNM